MMRSWRAYRNVLDNHIRRADDFETLAFDDTAGAVADNGLIRANLDTRNTSVVVGHRNGGCLGVVVTAPVVLVDGSLAL